MVCVFKLLILDSMLLTASNDKSLKTWDVETGRELRTFSRHSDLVSSCAWLPCGRKFVSGSVDKVCSEI
jgi:WD40 repeat protein